MVEFNPPATVAGGLNDEETMPLDAEASIPDHEGDVAGTAEGSDRDEDPGV